MAYLDHAAATPIFPEALEEMARVASSHFANPSGVHRGARAARARLEEAREEIALSLGVGPHDVVFTSGGTESDNMALAGAPAARRVVSAVEHKAVLQAAPSATVVPVDNSGVLDLDGLRAALGDDVAVVSVMTANNEVGALQPVAEALEMVRRHAPGALFHTDAVQAFGYVELPPADLVTITSHKLGGPRGIGALVVRPGVALEPLVRGGSQEEGRRAGTEDVAAAAGFAVAATRARRERPAEASRLDALADRLAVSVSDLARRNGPVEPASRLPTICHLTVDGCRSEDLLVLLDRFGVSASAGSACASGAVEPSHVLAAMGMSEQEARASLRFSLGWTSTEADVDAAACALRRSVEVLRG